MTSCVPFVVLPPGSVSAVPVPASRGAEVVGGHLADPPFLAGRPGARRDLGVGAAWGPVTSRHLPLIRNVPSLYPVHCWVLAPGLHFHATTAVPSAARVMHIPLKGLATVPVPAGNGLPGVVPGAVEAGGVVAGVLAVAGAVVAGVLAGADGAAVVLVPGELVAPAPDAVPWLAQPASTARHAAAASEAAERVIVIGVSPRSGTGPFRHLQSLRLAGQDNKEQGRWSRRWPPFASKDG